MRIGDIRKKLPPYIEWLGLNEPWKEFEIRWAKRGELPKDELGNADWDIDHRKAILILSRNADLRTAVHELWHIRIEGHAENALPRNPHYEQTIWYLTDKLLAEIQ